MQKAKIQRTASGKPLGVCISVSSEHLKHIADREYVNIEIVPHDENTEIRITASDEVCEEVEMPHPNERIPKLDRSFQV